MFQETDFNVSRKAEMLLSLKSKTFQLLEEKGSLCFYFDENDEVVRFSKIWAHSGFMLIFT